MLNSRIPAANWFQTYIIIPTGTCSSFFAVIDFPDIKDHGWTEDGTTVWTKDVFPADIIDILYEDISDSEYIIDSEGESEDEF